MDDALDEHPDVATVSFGRRAAIAAQAGIRRPHVLIPLGAVVSVIAWASPAGGARGFDIRTDPTLAGVVVFAGWYAVAAVAAWLGWRATGRVPLWQRLDDRPTDVVHWRATVVAVVGVVGTYVLIEVRDPGLIVDALRTQTFNRLRQAIPFEAGFSTLRYAAIAAGGISIGRLLSGRRPRAVDGVAIVMLIANSALASRLALGLAVFMAVYTIDLRPDPERRERGHAGTLRVVVLCVALFVALMGFNYIRNAGYYRERAGIDNPVTMTYYEGLRYWNAPTQVGLAVADPDVAAALRERVEQSTTRHLVQYVVPTYFTSPDEGVSSDKEHYRDVVDVNGTLTTNSIPTAMFPTLGIPLSFVVMTVTCGLVGAAVRYVGRFRGAAMFIAPALAYPFVEFWRVWIFNAGVVHFVALLLLALALTARRTTDDDVPEPAEPA